MRNQKGNARRIYGPRELQAIARAGYDNPELSVTELVVMLCALQPPVNINVKKLSGMLGTRHEGLMTACELLYGPGSYEALRAIQAKRRHSPAEEKPPATEKPPMDLSRYSPHASLIVIHTRKASTAQSVDEEEETEEVYA